VTNTKSATASRVLPLHTPTDLKSSAVQELAGALNVLLADHSLYRLEADLRWIDHAAARLDMLELAVRR